MFRPHSPTCSGARRRVWIALATVAVLLAAAASAQAAPFAYVTTHNKVFQYDIGAGGLLAPMVPAAVATGDGSLGIAVSPDGESVYVANQDSVWGGRDDVSQYDVGPGGALSPKSPATVAAGTYPNRVAVSPDGQSVYVTNDGSYDVSQYDVGASGELSPKSPATVAAGPGAWGVAVSPDGQSVYVTNAWSNTVTEPASVSQYDVGAGGALSPKSPATVAADEFPAGVAVSPDGQGVYVTNNLSDDISQYDVGPDGALSPKSPATVATGDGPAGVAVSPDGQSVYVTNNYVDNVSQYDVSAGGALSPKSPPTVAAGDGPIGIAVSPDGQGVYVTNDLSDDISQYDVGHGGALSLKRPAMVATGADPIEVAVSPAAPIPTSEKQCKQGGWKRFGFKRPGGCIRFVKRKARQSCRAERDAIGRHAFRKKYGKGKHHHRRPLHYCVKQAIGGG